MIKQIIENILKIFFLTFIIKKITKGASYGRIRKNEKRLFV